jgi:hypothetical protein
MATRRGEKTKERKKAKNKKKTSNQSTKRNAGEMSINIRPATKEDALFLGWVVVHAAQSHLEWGFFEAELYVLHLATIAPEARECRPLRCLTQARSLAATLPPLHDTAHIQTRHDGGGEDSTDEGDYRI